MPKHKPVLKALHFKKCRKSRLRVVTATLEEHGKTRDISYCTVWEELPFADAEKIKREYPVQYG